MKWFTLPAAALAAAACITALTSNDVRASSRRFFHRKFVHKRHVVTRKPVFADPSILPLRAIPTTYSTYAPSRGENIARTALAYRGMPYRFGGRSERSGFDCSGLVQAVCAKWGFYLPRVAGAQFTKGAPVQQMELQPGDLVFFKNTYKSGLSHVGIFIGEGQFVHAAGRRKGVQISYLADSFYQKHWAGARRLDLKQLPHTEDESAFTPPQPADITVDAPASLPVRKVEAAWQPRSYHHETPSAFPDDERIAGEGTTTGRRTAPR